MKSTEFIRDMAVLSVANAWGVEPAEILARSKSIRVSDPRVAAYSILYAAGFNKSEIGELIGGRDHSTVISGLERTWSLVDTEPQYRIRYRDAYKDFINGLNDRSARVYGGPGGSRDHVLSVNDNQMRVAA